MTLDVKVKLAKSKDGKNLRARTVDRLLEAGLWIMGVWPKTRRSIYHKLAWTLTLGSAQIFQYSYIITHYRHEDLSELMESLSTTLSYSTVVVKLIILWFKRQAFRETISAMEQDQIECTPPDWRHGIMMENAAFAERCSKYILFMYWMTVVLFAGGIITANIRLDAAQRKHVLRMEFPFESTVSPMYEIVTAVQLTQQLIAISVEATMNALIVKLILHVGSRVDIIRRELSELSQNDGKADMDKVKILIGRHYKVIKFAENVECIFSYPALVHIMSNTLLLCLLGFALVTSFNSGQGAEALVKFIPYYGVACINAFMYCFGGEYLTVKSQSVADAAYESSWYDLKPSVNRGLLLLILRSQKRLTITVGKFMDLSYECFTTMLKASASYVSVLHAMY